MSPLERTANFCANCGADISGVWGADGQPLGKTLAVEIDANVDTVAQLLTQATLGDYDIYGELGRGGMAAVYLALDLALNRKVAIKTMLPELVSRPGMVPRFKREAQTAAGLSHPHIIQIYSVKETKQLVYFVMKFIEGRSLESVITEKGRIELPMSQVILTQVSSALAYAHKKHVVHRDIKPANIMLDEDGWAIVTDFGIAKVQEEQQQHLTATGTAIGTPHYMSPEQCHNKQVTGLSDQYSLGVLAYEMLAGKKPFDGSTYAEILTQHLFEPPPDIRTVRPDIPEHVAKAIMRMMAKDPAQRFPDCDAAAVEIGAPQRTEGDAVRTQMVSIVKNGPRKSVRMSVPISPIPISNRTAVDPAAKTVIERPAAAPAAPAKPRPTPAAQPKKQPVALIAGIAAIVVLGIGGFVGWRAMTKPAQSAPSSVAVVPTGQPAAADSSQPQVAGNANTGAPAATAPDTKSAAGVAEAPAQVTVTNAPANATITVDGRRQARAQFSVRPGAHEIRVEARGFEPMTQRATVSSGERLQIAFTRRAVAVSAASTAPASVGGAAPQSKQGLATLRIAIQPAALVFLDGAAKGQQVRVQEEVIPGTHTLRIERDGWVTKDTTVTLTAGQIATVRIQLVERRP
jgi:serine/threonine protein kinase